MITILFIIYQQSRPFPLLVNCPFSNYQKAKAIFHSTNNQAERADKFILGYTTILYYICIMRHVQKSYFDCLITRSFSLAMSITEKWYMKMSKIQWPVVFVCVCCVAICALWTDGLDFLLTIKKWICG